MKAADLDILLQEGEGVMLEYKEGLSSSFARELVGFANTAGGRILLGVRDDGTVKGIADTNELRARIQDIACNCDPPVKILLHRIAFIEKAGTGIRRMREGARDQGYPEPEFSAGSFFSAVFRPIAPVAGHDEAHDEAHEPLSIVEHRLLTGCADEPQSTLGLLQTLGYKTRTGSFKAALSHLLALGFLEMIIPDKPRSKKQRYRITPAGLAVLEHYNEVLRA